MYQPRVVAPVFSGKSPFACLMSKAGFQVVLDDATMQTLLGVQHSGT